MNSLVSIVVPTHNRDELLIRALNSILNQTYQNFEVFVVDDVGNSTTRDIVSSISDNRFKYVYNNEHRGAAYSRNIGIQLAEGEFISFLDDDDEWYPLKLEVQLNKFKQGKNIAIVYGKMNIFISDLNIVYTTKPQKKGNIFNELLMENCVGGTIVPMLNLKLIAKQECYFDVNFPAREEYDLWIRLSKKYNFDYTEEILAIAYTEFQKERISSNIDNYEKGINLINNKYQEEILLLSNNDKLQREILQLRFLASQAIKVNNMKIARDKYYLALKLKFSMKNLVFYLISFLSAKNVFLLRKYIKV